MRSSTIARFHTMAALGLLLLVGVHGATIISIKYPEKSAVEPQPAKRDLSLSYAATNIDSKEGTRVKTITVIKNVGGISAPEEAATLGSSITSSHNHKQQPKLIIDPSLHKSEEWASAFRDNFDSYGALPDVPDIDDLFEFVNRKKPEGEKKQEEVPSQKEERVPKELQKPAEETTTKKAGASEQSEGGIVPGGNIDSDEAVVEKIKGDAELLPHIKQANILRLQAAHAQARSGIRTKESLIAVNYSTPMHQVSQYFDNYVQAVSNGYDYPKPCGVQPGNSIQVTTPSGRTYDIPQSNSSGTGGGNHPYLAPELTKRTQIPPITVQPPVQQQQPQPPNYSSVNSIVPPIVQPQPQGNANLPQQPQQPPVVSPPNGGILPPLGTGGISTSQRPYVAPRLRNNGLGISRAPSTPGPIQIPGQPGLVGNNPQQTPNFRTSNFGGGANRPNTLRSRGLKY
ncbi:B-cell CLL/lymphoma 9 protein [Drosophila sechellia]|uniref:GM14422 n=1 Tax=Drosophila sechellia TaxID=7238 RepID=B4HVV3_DROSE|nr:B-cell CLL/lymphoma 9 protein [Drosophila sechellia]EDW50068.1 GM14422 [Drosophila sechellia]